MFILAKINTFSRS